MVRRVVAVWFISLVCAACAYAGDYNFTYSGGQLGVTVTGTLVATPLGNGQYDITSLLNGQIDGIRITKLLPINSFGGNDNFLYLPPNAGYLDANGFTFVDAKGEDINIFYDGSYELLGSGPTRDVFGNFTLTPAVPENSALVLWGSGLLGLFALSCRRSS